MTGNIINEGTNVFIPIMDKLGNIASEFLPYILYIGIAIIGIELVIHATKMIISYLEFNSKNTFGNGRINQSERVTVGMPERTKEQLINEYNYEYQKTYNKIGAEGLAGLHTVSNLRINNEGDIEYKSGYGEYETTKYDKQTKERLDGEIKRIKSYR